MCFLESFLLTKVLDAVDSLSYHGSADFLLTLRSPKSADLGASGLKFDCDGSLDLMVYLKSDVCELRGLIRFFCV